MNYKLSDILQAQIDLQTVNADQLSIDLNDNIPFLVEIIERFKLTNNGKAKRDLAFITKKVEEANSILLELAELSTDFATNLANAKKKAHQDLLKSVNNDLYNFVWEADSDYIAHRKQWAVRNSVIDQTIALLGKYVDWRLPVIYLEPNTGELTRHLVSGEPFYVVDDRKLPYQQMLDSMPPESKNRLYYYSRATADQYLESNSAALAISWKNFAFKKLGDIKKDIEFMSTKVAPGGFVVFDYVNAETVNGATAIENGLCAFQWRTRICQFLAEYNLEIVHEFDFIDHPCSLLFCKKSGELPDLPLGNKIGLVLADQEVLAERRRQETEIMKFYKSISSKLADDLQRIEDKNQLLNELEVERKIDTKKITEQKLKTALNNLDLAITQYDYKHPIVLESILNVSKLTHSLGRKKDSVNLIKRVQRDVDQLDQSLKIVAEYRSWTDFLNNN